MTEAVFFVIHEFDDAGVTKFGNNSDYFAAPGFLIPSRENDKYFTYSATKPQSKTYFDMTTRKLYVEYPFVLLYNANQQNAKIEYINDIKFENVTEPLPVYMSGTLYFLHKSQYTDQAFLNQYDFLERPIFEALKKLEKKNNENGNASQDDKLDENKDNSSSDDNSSDDGMPNPPPIAGGGGDDADGYYDIDAFYRLLDFSYDIGDYVYITLTRKKHRISSRYIRLNSDNTLTFCYLLDNSFVVYEKDIKSVLGAINA